MRQANQCALLHSALCVSSGDGALLYVKDAAVALDLVGVRMLSSKLSHFEKGCGLEVHTCQVLNWTLHRLATAPTITIERRLRSLAFPLYSQALLPQQVPQNFTAFLRLRKQKLCASMTSGMATWELRVSDSSWPQRTSKPNVCHCFHAVGAAAHNSFIFHKHPCHSEVPLSTQRRQLPPTPI